MCHLDSVGFAISQFRLSQIQPFGLSQNQLSGLSQITRPALKIHNKEDEAEPQGEPTQPRTLPEYPVHQAALEHQHEKWNIQVN